MWQFVRIRQVRIKAKAFMYRRKEDKKCEKITNVLSDKTLTPKEWNVE